MTRHYMVKITHIQGNEFFEEHVPFPSSVTNTEEAIKRFHSYAEKTGFNKFIARSYLPAGGFYTQIDDERNTLNFR